MSNRTKRAQRPSRGQRAAPAKPRPLQLCVYCQERPANTVEHVIARGFFGSMPPKHAVKVPACKECNEGRGDGQQRPMTMDEEYCRTVFASEIHAYDHPVAASLLAGEIARSFDNSPALLRRIGRSMELVDARTSAGIIIPNVPQMTIEFQRVARVMTKITRGLFYAMARRALPPTMRVRVSAKITQEQAKTISDMQNRWINSKWINVGDEQAFTFKGAIPDVASNHSVWLLIFYRSLIFCTDTLPHDQGATTGT